jgi:hypothetical protein
MREFLKWREQFGFYMKSMPAIADQTRIDSTEKMMRFINTMAAAQVRFNLGGPAGDAGPSGGFGEGVMPATAPQPQPMAPEDEARFRQQEAEGHRRGMSFGEGHMTPEGTQQAIEDRRRGAYVPPADTAASINRYGKGIKFPPGHFKK